ncbi:hypothetical protein FISHEDRAFT_68532 [Fistulina hepatica ATCC 64428]|uniref:Uncharacterized protein n=1 Tax=Fistulina hepatica ATCC 64428 TaxID=1128425 RepID=A0A0D7AQK4_9AGAR|nr:hypothetical protein FISHEDRAFT_68532 [Fistulina hepatica ATCC 64428]
MKVMGPRRRSLRDCLEYHLGYRNFIKKARARVFYSFDEELHFLNAEQARCLSYLKDFETSLNGQQAALHLQWSAQFEEMWKDVRLRLAEEEKAEATRAAALGHIRSKLTAQKLLLQGLELEELQ